MTQAIIYTIIISIGVFFYRLGMRIITIHPAWFICISGLIIFLLGGIIILSQKQFTFPDLSTQDILGILMVAITTCFVDFLIVQGIQRGVPAISLNILTSVFGLILFVFVSVYLFHDKITGLQVIGIILGCISFFLLMYK